MYCAYCGRVAHRCTCRDESSPIRQFLARRPVEFVSAWMPAPYKRGVPPQIKRRERAALRRSYTNWFARLAEQYGERCSNCGQSGADRPLVIDHILPIARGGLSEYDNLQLLCAECNRLKGKYWIDCREE